MSRESIIPIASQPDSRRFAAGLALFYGTLFGLGGTHLPFFPVWLRAVGIDAFWIGLITAVPSVTRFTILPLVTGFAGGRYSLRGALIVTAIATALGLAWVGIQDRPLWLFIVYALTSCLWTPMVPLTDAYALRGVARYGLHYGPLRLWGSASFAAGALACGLMVDVIAGPDLIWVIVAAAALGVVASLGLAPVEQQVPRQATQHGARKLWRDRGFLCIILAASLIQGSHAAYYTFASITWQAEGFDGLTIAGLWTLGVLAEIVVFALSPRFTLSPQQMMWVGGVSAALRWLVTAQQPPVGLLALVQLAHGLSYGLTQLGTMGLLVRRVPNEAMARGQGYLAACFGLVYCGASVVTGELYLRAGQDVYYIMAALALAGALVIGLAHGLFKDHPHSAASGG
jgi:PPP family 3-phenylpropionic acid transporter